MDDWIAWREALGEALAVEAALARDVFGNPFLTTYFEQGWLTADIVALASAGYEERSLSGSDLDPIRLAVLADALEDAGAGEDITGHLRGPGPHVRGCWAVDLCLGMPWPIRLAPAAP